MKTYTMEELKAVKFVQNISGGIAYLGDLSESGEDGKGVTLRPDEILELRTVVNDDAKVKSRSLKKGLEGFPGDMGFSPVAPVLQVIDGPGDPRIIKTTVKGNLIDKGSPKTRERNIFDVALMEQNLRDLQEELESTQDAGKRATLEVTISQMQKTVDEQRSVMPTGVEANIVRIGGGTDGKGGIL